MLLIFCIMLSLGGCTTSDEIGQSKKAEITVYYPMNTWGSLKNSESVIDTAKKVFETKYENITVNLYPAINIDFNDVNKEIKDGQKVDVIITMGNPIDDYDFSTEGISLPLDNLINKNQKFFDGVYDDGVLNNVAVGGFTYVLPLTSQTRVFYFNKNIIKKYNIDLKPDWTWDDFYNTCSTIAKGGDDILPSSFDSDRRLLDMYTDSLGIKIFNEKTGEGSVSGPGMLEAINLEKGIRALNAYNDSLYFDFGDLNNGLYAFDYSFIRIASINAFRNSHPNTDFIGSPLKNDSFIMGQYSYGCINKNSDVQKEAFEFIKVLLSDEIQKKAIPGNPVNKNTFKSFIDTLDESLGKKVYDIFHRTDFSMDSPASRNFSNLLRYFINQALDKNDTIDESYLTKLIEEANKAQESYASQ